MLALGLVLAVAGAAGAQTIATVAGGGPPADATPLEVAVGEPTGLVFDGAGDLLIATNAANRVYKVTTLGEVFVVAGTGREGFAGDGGPAADAELALPHGVDFDSAGNLYIADTNNHRIRKIDAATGNISTIAGNGTEGFSGDEGPATSAALRFPTGVFVDATDEILISDWGNHRIRKVDTSGDITTLAGNGIGGFSGDNAQATDAQLYYPTNVCRDASGDLLIADYDNHRIRKVDATGVITTFAGTGVAGFSGDGGQATSAQFTRPFSVFLDASGNVLIGDSENHRVRRIDSGGVITTVAGSGSVGGFSGDGGLATNAVLNTVAGVTEDAAGDLFIGDFYNRRIRKVTVATGTIDTFAGNGSPHASGDGGPAIDAELFNPAAAVSDPDPGGDFLIVDYGNHQIRRVDAAGDISTIAGVGPPPMGYENGPTGDGGPATAAQLYNPADAVIAANGDVLIADTDNNRVRRVTSGVISTVAGTGTPGYTGDNIAATGAQLSKPFGLDVDSVGNIFIADSENHRIRRVDATSGTITTFAGTGTNGLSGDGGAATAARINYPTGVFVDALDNVLIADNGNHRIRRVDECRWTVSIPTPSRWDRSLRSAPDT